MTIKSLLARLERQAVTPVTSEQNQTSHWEPASLLAVTPVTPVMLEKRKYRIKTFSADQQEAFQEKAAVLEYDAGYSRQEAEQLAWNMIFKADRPTNVPRPFSDDASG